MAAASRSCRWQGVVVSTLLATFVTSFSPAAAPDAPLPLSASRPHEVCKTYSLIPEQTEGRCATIFSRTVNTEKAVADFIPTGWRQAWGQLAAAKQYFGPPGRELLGVILEALDLETNARFTRSFNAAKAARLKWTALYLAAALCCKRDGGGLPGFERKVLGVLSGGLEITKLSFADGTTAVIEPTWVNRAPYKVDSLTTEELSELLSKTGIIEVVFNIGGHAHGNQPKKALFEWKGKGWQAPVSTEVQVMEIEVQHKVILTAKNVVLGNLSKGSPWIALEEPFVQDTSSEEKWVTPTLDNDYKTKYSKWIQQRQVSLHIQVFSKIPKVTKFRLFVPVLLHDKGKWTQEIERVTTVVVAQSTYTRITEIWVCEKLKPENVRRGKRVFLKVQHSEYTVGAFLEAIDWKSAIKKAEDEHEVKLPSADQKAALVTPIAGRVPDEARLTDIALPLGVVFEKPPVKEETTVPADEGSNKAVISIQEVDEKKLENVLIALPLFKSSLEQADFDEQTMNLLVAPLSHASSKEPSKIEKISAKPPHRVPFFLDLKATDRKQPKPLVEGKGDGIKFVITSVAEVHKGDHSRLQTITPTIFATGEETLQQAKKSLQKQGFKVNGLPVQDILVDREDAPKGSYVFATGLVTSGIEPRIISSKEPSQARQQRRRFCVTIADKASGKIHATDLVLEKLVLDNQKADVELLEKSVEETLKKDFGLVASKAKVYHPQTQLQFPHRAILNENQGVLEVRLEVEDASKFLSDMERRRNVEQERAEQRRKAKQAEEKLHGKADQAKEEQQDKTQPATLARATNLSKPKLEEKKPVAPRAQGEALQQAGSPKEETPETKRGDNGEAVTGEAGVDEPDHPQYERREAKFLGVERREETLSHETPQHKIAPFKLGPVAGKRHEIAAMREALHCVASEVVHFLLNEDRGEDTQHICTYYAAVLAGFERLSNIVNTTEGKSKKMDSGVEDAAPLWLANKLLEFSKGRGEIFKQLEVPNKSVKHRKKVVEACSQGMKIVADLVDPYDRPNGIERTEPNLLAGVAFKAKTTCNKELHMPVAEHYARNCEDNSDISEVAAVVALLEVSGKMQSFAREAKFEQQLAYEFATTYLPTTNGQAVANHLSDMNCLQLSKRVYGILEHFGHSRDALFSKCLTA